ncbi:DJ-1 family protein [Cardiosporidium cionae]|uniref:DJ-1 family protein n=1 Tax=Cardiosporidium cionae TaxID=476202 RepID=A0ABQ7J5W4_9APIC|nr:DJ-1 family protein [Cardiosporidium cionae]|eukprot:KAF8819353.1 DJ-1 family protein [Cardiosporidium cionae]
MQYDKWKWCNVTAHCFLHCFYLSAAAKVLVPVASGCEDIEIVSIVDTLRRAGAVVNVVLASSRDLSASDPLVITAMNGMKMVAEMHIEDVHNDEFDMIVIPGGIPGAEHLSNCKILIKMLRKQKERGGRYAAICASPKLVLEAHGLLDVSETEKMQATSYPAPPFLMENDMRDRVVVSGNCTTSQGPGTAIEFALVLVEQLYGTERAQAIKNDLVSR